MSKIDLNTAPLKDLVALYNEHAKKNDQPLVMRFSSRAAAIKRIEAITGGKATKAKVKKAAPVKEKAQKAKAPAKVKAPKSAKVPATDSHEVRSHAIAESWKDPEVKERRAKRHAVRVDGKEFRSVKQAFEELRLPLNEHIKFRMQLKAAGKLKHYDKKWEAVEVN